MEQRTVEVGGLHLAARTADFDTMPGLVLLHGWPQSSRAFDNVVDELGRYLLGSSWVVPKRWGRATS